VINVYLQERNTFLFNLFIYLNILEKMCFLGIRVTNITVYFAMDHFDLPLRNSGKAETLNLISIRLFRPQISQGVDLINL